MLKETSLRLNYNSVANIKEYSSSTPTYRSDASRLLIALVRPWRAARPWMTTATDHAAAAGPRLTIAADQADAAWPRMTTATDRRQRYRLYTNCTTSTPYYYYFPFCCSPVNFSEISPCWAGVLRKSLPRKGRSVPVQSFSGKTFAVQKSQRTLTWYR